MMGKTHAVTSVCLWASVAPLVTTHSYYLLGGALIAVPLAYLPDLDHWNSTSSRRLWGPLHKRCGKAFASLVGGHRRGMHSLWACLAAGLMLGVAATAIAPWLDVRVIALAGFLGYLGGILGDMLTKQRVHFLWPLSDRKIGIALIKTNRWGEHVFNVLQVAAAGGAVYWHVGG